MTVNGKMLSWLAAFISLAALLLLGGCTPVTVQTATLPALQASPQEVTASPTSPPVSTMTPTPTHTPIPTPTLTQQLASPSVTAPAVQPVDLGPLPEPHPDATLQFRAPFIAALAAFSPQGDTILLLSDSQLALVDAATTALLVSLDIPGRITAFDLSPDGSMLAISAISESGEVDIHVYETQGGNLLYTISSAHQGLVTALRYTPAGDILASAAHDGTVKLWHTRDGAAQITVPAHGDQVTCMAVSPDGTQIITGSFGSDKEIHAWTVSGEKIFTLTKNNTHCYLAAFSPDSQWLLFHSRDKMRLHRVSDWGREWLADFDFGLTPLVGFAPDGRVYLGNRAGMVQLMEPAAQQVTLTLQLGPLVGFDFSPEGTQVVVLRSNGVVEVLDWGTGP